MEKACKILKEAQDNSSNKYSIDLWRHLLTDPEISLISKSDEYYALLKIYIFAYTLQANSYKL